MGGGSGSKTSNEPWSAAQPYLRDVMSQAQQQYQQGGQLNPQQQAGWSSQLDYAQGALQSPLYGQTVNAVSGALQGGPYSQFVNPSSGAAGSALSSQLGGGYYGGLVGGDTGTQAQSALQAQLSGTPNYSAVQGAVDAANQQANEYLTNQVIPGLNQRASFLQNPTGSIKGLNQAVTDVGKAQSQYAQQAYLNEYNRAQAAQQSALGQYSGLLGGAQQAQQTGLGQYLSGLGGVAGSQAQGVSQYPTIYGLGAQPGQLQTQYGNTLADTSQQNLANYANIIQGFGGLGGTSSQRTSSNPWGTVAQIGGSVLGAALLSDRRAKTDIAPIGRARNGLEIYRFRYKGERTMRFGYMADEVREKYPEAVSRGLDGLDRVNYAMVA